MWTKVHKFWANRDQSSKFGHFRTFLFLNFGPQNLVWRHIWVWQVSVQNLMTKLQNVSEIWETKVHQFRENRNQCQNLTPPVTFSFLYFGPQYLDAFSRVFQRRRNMWTKVQKFWENRDQSSKFGHLIFLFLNFGPQNLLTLLGLASKCAKFYVKTPNRFRDMRHFSSLISRKLELFSKFDLL